MTALMLGLMPGAPAGAQEDIGFSLIGDISGHQPGDVVTLFDSALPPEFQGRTNCTGEAVAVELFSVREGDDVLLTTEGATARFVNVARAPGAISPMEPPTITLGENVTVSVVLGPDPGEFFGHVVVDLHCPAVDDAFLLFADTSGSQPGDVVTLFDTPTREGFAGRSCSGQVVPSLLGPLFAVREGTDVVLTTDGTTARFVNVERAFDAISPMEPPTITLGEHINISVVLGPNTGESFGELELRLHCPLPTTTTTTTPMSTTTVATTTTPTTTAATTTLPATTPTTAATTTLPGTPPTVGSSNTIPDTGTAASSPATLGLALLAAGCFLVVAVEYMRRTKRRTRVR